MRLLTSIVFLAAGCVGSVGDENPGDGSNPPPSGRTAREIYKSDVHPVVAKCSGNACHDITATASGALSKFYSMTADTSYDAAVASTSLIGTFSSIAPILTHIQAGHKGLSWTNDETTKITAWLAAETKERAQGGGSNQPPPFDATAAIKTWSGCLSEANFTAAGMAQAWSALAADNQQKCANCHTGGIAGFLISNSNTTFFNQLSTQAAYLLKYFTVDSAQRKVIVNTGSFKSATMIPGHPTFNATTNAGMTALQKLYDSTLARQTANQCDPPRIVN